MKFSRHHWVIAISLIVVILLAGYGVCQKWPRLFNKYSGLTTTLEIQMDDTTRILVQQRLATTQASINASLAKGEKPEMNLYLTLAEYERLSGNLIASRENYETYLALNPASYVAHKAYATVLDIMGDYSKAEPEFKAALDGLKTEEYYRDYAEFLATRYPDRTDDYKAVIEEAFVNLGQTTWTMLTLGDWYFAHNDCEQGRQHYAVAKALAPDQAEQITSDSEEKDAACTK